MKLTIAHGKEIFTFLFILIIHLIIKIFESLLVFNHHLSNQREDKMGIANHQKFLTFFYLLHH